MSSGRTAANSRSQPSRKALYPGSFDPATLGHLDLIRRGASLFGALTVGVAVNPQKNPLFSPQERVAMLEAEARGIPGVAVVSFQGLVVDYCRKHGFEVILRGVRTVSDFEAEYQMALTNRLLAPEIETVFVMPNEKYSYVSSRLIKEILESGGDASAFLPAAVEKELRERIRKGSRGPA